MPVSTSADGIPAAFAPLMSVSRRSPTKNGRCAEKRSTAVVNSGVSGLPATTEPPDRRVHGGHERPVAGRDAAVDGDGPVRVRGHPESIGVGQRERRLGEVLPAELRSEALHDRVRRVVRIGGEHEARLQHDGAEPFAADDEDPGVCGKPVGQQPDRGLRRGHDLVRLGVEPEAAQLVGDGGRREALFVM